MELKRPGPGRTLRSEDLLLVADVIGWVWSTWASWVALLMLISGDDLTSPAWQFLNHVPGHYYAVGGVLMGFSLGTTVGLLLRRTLPTIAGIFGIGGWSIWLSYQLASATKYGSNTGNLSSSAWLLIGLLCFFHVVLLIRGRR